METHQYLVGNKYSSSLTMLVSWETQFHAYYDQSHPPSLCGNCAVFAFFFIISVQTNNPGDLANRLSLIARLLKTLHCNTIAIPREELPMGVNVILLLDSFYNVKVTNGSYRKVWRVWLNLYRYILFQILHLTTLGAFTSERIYSDISVGQLAPLYLLNNWWNTYLSVLYVLCQHIIHYCPSWHRFNQHLIKKSGLQYFAGMILS